MAKLVAPSSVCSPSSATGLHRLLTIQTAIWSETNGSDGWMTPSLQFALVIMDLPEAFRDAPGMATGWENKIITPPVIVVRTHVQPVLIAL